MLFFTYSFAGQDPAAIGYLKKVAATFSQLYEHRQTADYDLTAQETDPTESREMDQISVPLCAPFDVLFRCTPLIPQQAMISVAVSEASIQQRGIAVPATQLSGTKSPQSLHHAAHFRQKLFTPVRAFPQNPFHLTIEPLAILIGQILGRHHNDRRAA